MARGDKMKNIILKATGMICITVVSSILAFKGQYREAVWLEAAGIAIIFIFAL